jgi:hypothetical protein
MSSNDVSSSTSGGGIAAAGNAGAAGLAPAASRSHSCLEVSRGRLAASSSSSAISVAGSLAMRAISGLLAILASFSSARRLRTYMYPPAEAAAATMRAAAIITYGNSDGPPPEMVFEAAFMVTFMLARDSITPSETVSTILNVPGAA